MEGHDSDSSPVTREDEDEISECCSKWRSRLFFIEIQMTLVLLLYMNSAQLVQQYIFQRIARETLAHTPNYTAPNHSICLDQDYIVNNTGSNESIIKIQKEANDLAMYLEVIRLGMSAVTALFYGSLSDIFGRKPILALCLLGLSLCCGLQVAVIELNLNMHIYLLVAAGINGLFGGFASIVGVCFAAVSDVATKKWRTLRMSTTESAIGFGKLSSYLVVYYWIDNNGCDFRLPAYSMLGIALVAFIYLLLLPESLPAKENRKEGGFKKLLDGTKLFVLPSKLSFSKWWRLWICVLILTIQCFCSVGIAQVINYFLHNKPLEWSYDIIGIYGVVAAISHIITLVVVLPLLLALPLPEGLLNPIIIIFGAIVGVGTNVMMATVKTDWEMFLGKYRFYIRIIMKLICSWYSSNYTADCISNIK